ncbi:T9SS type A sorting domain-containing protein [Epilithonimonas sp. JDS]|uniref:ELWxxDGT repeat protein n=1 Tax=Epilithonimonas sp. JDS TaxID=2902797 RepID=UPI001E492A7C|nr:ELWxxDGT repeat protein [Epilithonimonas sp. JDS]MCD9855174.1 T9SS type A sorting domain-containing protein [Epilithonimonas sp. JDS]
MIKINFLAILLGGLLSAQTTFTLVKDINPGQSNSAPSNFMVFNNKMYFSATYSPTGSVTGTELWESDGTEAGTRIVADISPGLSSSSPTNLYNFGGRLYFIAALPVNGTNTSGVLMSYNNDEGLKTVSTTAKFASNFLISNNKLYFKATNSTVTPNTQRLYTLDDSLQPVIVDDNVNVMFVGNVGQQIIANGQYKTATNPTWYQLFSMNTNTLDLLKTINPSGTAYPQNFYYSPALGKSFFSANGGNGQELWMSDGTVTGTIEVKDINTATATAGSGVANFTEYNGKIYFSASDGATSGAELWVTDGTEQGTKMLKDILPGSTGSFPEKLVVFKNKLYFLLNNSGGVRQLWESDGTESGTKLLSSLPAAFGLAMYNDNLYVSARVNASDQIGVELYKVNLPDETLAINNISTSKVNVYPNPSKGAIIISNMTSGTFELLDTTGRLIKAGNFENSKVDLNSKAGNYILKVTSKDKKTHASNKVIIQ